MYRTAHVQLGVDTKVTVLATEGDEEGFWSHLSRMVGRRCYKVTRLSLFLYGTRVILHYAPISGGIRKMDDAWDSGIGSLFASMFLMVWMRRCRLTAAQLQSQWSNPDSHREKGKCRAQETLLKYWNCESELINGTGCYGNRGVFRFSSFRLRSEQETGLMRALK